MKIAILDDYAGISTDYADWSAIARQDEITVFRDHLDAATAAATLQPFDIVCTVRERMPLPDALLAQLPRLKLITIIGESLPGLDLEAAARRGILVCNARGATENRPVMAHATSELAWGLVLATVRHLSLEDQARRASGWQTRTGMILYGRTLGILGLGNLGRRVASYGKAFGMDVIAWSPNLTPEAAAAEGVEHVERDAFFTRSDVLSIHLRLSARTRGLVGAHELARMQPTAYLINTSRGPIVDEAALITALRDGRLAGAGLDVFDREPLPPGDPLRDAPNVTLTPHLGYFTQETMTAFYRGTVESVAAYLAGAPAAVLNPTISRG